MIIISHPFSIIIPKITIIISNNCIELYIIIYQILDKKQSQKILRYKNISQYI